MCEWRDDEVCGFNPWFLALTVAYGCAVVAPLIRVRSRSKPVVLASWWLVPVVLACPLLIPSASPGLRAVSAVISADIAFKIVDYFRRWDRLDDPSELLR